jgi:hypothetical protein
MTKGPHIDEQGWTTRLETIGDKFLLALDGYFPAASGSEGTLDPFNGGCLIVAQALQSVIGGEIVVMVDKDDYALHAAVLQDDLLWDYDGPLPPPAFVERYNTFVDDEAYLLSGYRSFREYDLEEAMESAELAGVLAGHFREMLPEYPDVGAPVSAHAA